MCVILVLQQGNMTRNGRRNFNAVLEFKWYAVRPNLITLGIYVGKWL